MYQKCQESKYTFQKNILLETTTSGESVHLDIISGVNASQYLRRCKNTTHQESSSSKSLPAYLASCTYSGTERKLLKKKHTVVTGKKISLSLRYASYKGVFPRTCLGTNSER